MGKRKYVNAMDVLPRDLFLQLQKVYQGYLYVPASASAKNQKKKELICKLIEDGAPVSEVAKSAGLTERRIRQIVKEMSGELPIRKFDIPSAKSESSPEDKNSRQSL